MSENKMIEFTRNEDEICNVGENDSETIKTLIEDGWEDPREPKLTAKQKEAKAKAEAKRKEAEAKAKAEAK